MKNYYDQVSGGQIQGLTRFCRIGVPKFLLSYMRNTCEGVLFL